MQRVVPGLHVRDFAESCKFYVDTLGFEVDWEWRHEPGLPVFAQLSCQGLSIYLSENEGDGVPGSLVYLYVPDVDAWYERLTGMGIGLEAPQDQPWGNREITFRDPDYNRFCVATPIVGAS